MLAHCAAVLRRRFTIDEVTEEDWDFQIGVNLKATFFLNRTAATHLKEQGRGGRIVNFSSQGWWTGGFGGSVVYSASKGGVTSMSRGLARTYAKDGITVNVVSPGGVDTQMMTANQTEEQLQGFLSWSRSAVWRPPRRSPAPSSSSPPNRRATSRARR